MLRFCDTDTLIDLNNLIILNKHANRALDEGAYKFLDPNGIHLLSTAHIVSRFGNTGFQRVMCYMKFKDEEKPRQVTLDLTPAQWESLDTYTKHMDEFLESAKECQECGHKNPHCDDDFICIICRMDQEGIRR